MSKDCCDEMPNSPTITQEKATSEKIWVGKPRAFYSMTNPQSGYLFFEPF